MQDRFMLAVFFVFLFSPTLRADETPGTNEAVAVDLPADVVMRVNGQDIPAEWFQHEFQSTFFRYHATQNVHQIVFEPFYKRMILSAKARELGLDKKSDVLDEMNRRITGMKQFMEYKVQMAELDILNTALVKELGLQTSPTMITESELKSFYNEFIKPRPGAPATLAEVPPAMLDSFRSQAAQVKLEAALDQFISGWESNMTIQINQSYIESVPVPEMKGDRPQE